VEGEDAGGPLPGEARRGLYPEKARRLYAAG